jgi:type I restriction enzyme R subunit
VIDGYLIDQDPPIQIVTRNAQDGVYLSEGEQVERLNPLGELINDTLADDQDFEVADFNRGLVIPAFNRGMRRAHQIPGSHRAAKNAGVLRHQRPCRYGG